MAAQLDGFVHRGHAQVVGAGVERGLGTAHRAVTVSVGLHHGHEAHAVVDALLDGARVMTDGVEVDLGPRPAAVDVGNEAQLVGVELGRLAVGPRVVARVLERALRSAAERRRGRLVRALVGRVARRRLLAYVSRRTHRRARRHEAVGPALRETGEPVGKILCHALRLSVDRASV